MLAELASTTAPRTPQVPPAVYPPRKRWTREECRTLEATGLWDRERLELIEGDLLTRLSKKRPHVIAFVLMLEWLTQVFGTRYLNPESPIDVAPHDNPTSEPEPDFAVLAKAATEYTTSNPGPRLSSGNDIRLVIEISDSTLAFDLGPKARLYARAGIADYWVVDLENRRLHIHRDPQDGAYATVTTLDETQTLTPLTAPAEILSVTAVLPPRT